MPQAPIPFADTQASGLEELGGAVPLAVNTLVDGTGTIRRRPTLATWSDFPSTIPGSPLYDSPVVAMVPFGDRLVYVTEDRWMRAVTPATATAQELTLTSLGVILDSTTSLAGLKRPQMLSTRTRVVAVGGGAPQMWDGTSAYSERLGGSPPVSTHIAALATRLVLTPDDDSGTFVWSGLGETLGHESWDPLDYAEAEARTDRLNAIHDNTNELFAFGSQSIQVFTPDPVVGFATGRALDVGLLAPYSVIRADDTFGFLDRERRFIITDGRNFNDDSIVSRPIERSIRALQSVTDCWGFRMKTDQWDTLVWMLPTDGKGFMFDRLTGRWSEWRAFGDTGYTSTAYITSACSWPERNLVLVGLSTGQIVKLDPDGTDDMGEVVKAEIVSGFQNRETDNRKKCNRVAFTFRRGAMAQTGTADRVEISWRDDLGSFCDPIVRDLGLAGDYNPVVEINSCGVYRRRQWKIEFTGPSALAFVSAIEDFTVLGN